MNSQDNKLINLAIHESSDPEMLERDAETKTGSHPNTASPAPEMLGYENEEDREAPLETDFDIAREDRVAEAQIHIVNRHAG